MILRTSVFGAHTLVVHVYHAMQCTWGQYTEGEPLYGGCQVIQEKVLGPEYPSLATTLSNWARLMHDQVRATIFQSALSSGSPCVIVVFAVCSRGTSP